MYRLVNFSDWRELIKNKYEADVNESILLTLVYEHDCVKIR
jgi:hypothetical protein